MSLSHAPGEKREQSPQAALCPGDTANTAVTSLFQLDDGRARPEAVPGGTVVVGLKVGFRDVVDGERGQDPTARVGPLHCVAFQGPHLQEVLLPCPGLGWGGQDGMRKRQVVETPDPPQGRLISSPLVPSSPDPHSPYNKPKPHLLPPILTSNLQSRRSSGSQTCSRHML